MEATLGDDFSGKAASSTHPEIIDAGGVTETFCDALIAEPFGETVRLRFARTIVRDGGKAELLFLLHMPTARFLEALRRMAGQFLPKPDGH